MSVRRILVTGATGQQGSAVISALFNSPPAYPFEVIALTRNPNSATAQSLASKFPKITLLAGDLNNCPAIFTSTGGPDSIWGVFSIQVASFQQKNAPADAEERQGMSLVDAALAAGVKHFVYTSVDRGGSNSINTPTKMPHFHSKHKIEKHLIEAAKEGAKNPHGMTYTILRPVAFYDNLTPDFLGKGFAAMWAKMASMPLQLVGTRDIGIFAALAFTHIDSDPDTWRNAAISLAGDEMTQPQASEVFDTVFGRKMPITFGLVASAVMLMVKELGVMFSWFKEVGYKADIAECRRINPDMQDFETWLRKESKFEGAGKK